MADPRTDNSGEGYLKIRQIISSVATVLVTVAQCIILDMFIFEFRHFLPCYYLFYVTDVLVVLLLITACGMSSVYFINKTKPFDKYGKCTEFLGYLPLASLSWLAYATVMIAKIATAYKYFANLLEHSESELFSPRTLKFTIAVSAPILQLMFFCHYNPSMLKDGKKHENKEGNADIGHGNEEGNADTVHGNEEGNADTVHGNGEGNADTLHGNGEGNADTEYENGEGNADPEHGNEEETEKMLKGSKIDENKEGSNVMIFALFAAVMFDILDSVEFMEVLFVQESNITSKMNFNLERSILAFPLIGFILPFFPLLILSCTYTHASEKKQLIMRLVHSLISILLINIPFFVIRLYLWGERHSDLSSFVMKNGILIFLSIFEVKRTVKLLIDKPSAAPTQRVSSDAVQYTAKNQTVNLPERSAATT
ncbi:uncharacterized protein LOC141901073 [Tubulanus polymorphus]|uniref:uncharacterized protein LOC141901073 n=1 Tax=Tubulanus polymorphus TaxID=672921 RepID=UPI003DA5427A